MMLKEGVNSSIADGSDLALNSYTNAGFYGDEETMPKCLKLSDSKIFQSDCKIPQSVEEERAEERRMKWNVRKNLAVVSVGFFLLFLAFNGLSNVQSSINPDEGLGTGSLCVIYVALVISCMFIPSLLIKKIGCKWTLVISPFFYSTFVAANFYPIWGTLIPTSILVGVAAAPLWSAHSTYINEIGKDYAFLIGETAEVVIGRFFGFFFMIFQSGQILGNLVSSLILNQVNDNITIDQEQLDICGANYCNQQLPFHKNITTGTINSTVDIVVPRSTDINQIYMLCGVYLACALASSVFMAVFLDPLERETEETPGIQLLTATFKQMKDAKQILLIPLTIFNGLEIGFMAGDFTKSLITCPLGVGKVGYVMMCLYVVNALSSMGCGILIKRTGRIPLFTFGAILNLSIALVILYWVPDPKNLYIFFLLAALWGMADSIWVTQITSIYGVVFHKNLEAAYSNHRLWESIGFAFSFGLSNYLCIDHKLDILISVLSVSMLGYYGQEILLLKQHGA